MSDNIPAAGAQFGALQSLTYSNMFANTAVMINWHCQRCQLSQIRPQWLVGNMLIETSLKVVSSFVCSTLEKTMHSVESILLQ